MSSLSTNVPSFRDHLEDEMSIRHSAYRAIETSNKAFDINEMAN